MINSYTLHPPTNIVGYSHGEKDSRHNESHSMSHQKQELAKYVTLDLDTFDIHSSPSIQQQYIYRSWARTPATAAATPPAATALRIAAPVEVGLAVLEVAEVWLGAEVVGAALVVALREVVTMAELVLLGPEVVAEDLSEEEEEEESSPSALITLIEAAEPERSP